MQLSIPKKTQSKAQSKAQRYFFDFLLATLVLCLAPAEVALATVNHSGSLTHSNPGSITLAKKKKKKKKSRKKKKRKKKSRKSSKKVKKAAPKFYSMALTLNTGYESGYGNGPGLNIRPWQALEFHSGVGYTLTGIRVGVGSDLLLELSPGFALQTGLILGYGTGTQSSVTIEGEFTEDASGQKSTIRASRDYDLTAYTYSSLRLGARIALSKTWFLYGVGNYNIILSGNEVVYTGDIKYDQAIEVTNVEQAEQTFEEKSRDEITAGGIGFTAGLIIEL